MADRHGRFDWAEPDEEVHTFVNDLVRPVGTYLYGRRLYEVMCAWETMRLPEVPPYMRDFAEVWRKAHKIVYSTSLPAVSTARTTLERAFDPDAVRRMKLDAERELAIGGPELAAHAFRAGLIDECHLILAPVVVGGGTPCLPADVRIQLELVDERRFAGGMVHLGYRTVQAG